MEIVLDGKLKTKISVVALGMFDGVHLGHQVLLKKAKALANSAGAPLIACTFMKHPMELIAPDKAPALLTTFEERAQIMSGLGVDYLYAMPFDHTTMNQLPECYVGELVRHFHPTDVVCGYNHSFGKEGKGSPALLAALGDALDFGNSVVPKITFQGRDLSSSAIRTLLAEGDAALARLMLGRPYQRLGVIAEQSGGTSSLVMPQGCKQSLPKGKYRVLITVDGKSIPTVLTMADKEKGSCFLSVNAPRNREVHIQFLNGKSSSRAIDSIDEIC